MCWVTVLKFGVTFLSGGLAGSALTQVCNYYRNKVQKMRIYYLEDDVQFKIPVVIDGVSYTNMHLKKYRLKNTTNKDIDGFSVRFVFDLDASIIDFSSHTKVGDSKSNINFIDEKKNECTLKVKDFNRGDNVDITLRIGSISDNSFYITEFDSTGFRIALKDKRKKQKKTISHFTKDLA